MDVQKYAFLSRTGLTDVHGNQFDANIRYAVLDVKRPIASVSRIVDLGGEVVFRRIGSHIVTGGGRTIAMKRTGGVFTIDATIRPN